MCRNFRRTKTRANKENQLIFSLITPVECRSCNRIREKLSFSQLPERDRERWIMTGLVPKTEYFLFCEICNQYSAVSKAEWV
jgi:hypothetical protein